MNCTWSVCRTGQHGSEVWPLCFCNITQEEFTIFSRKLLGSMPRNCFEFSLPASSVCLVQVEWDAPRRRVILILGSWAIVPHLSCSPLSVLACGQAWDLDFTSSSSSGQLSFPIEQIGHKCFLLHRACLREDDLLVWRQSRAWESSDGPRGTGGGALEKSDEDWGHLFLLIRKRWGWESMPVWMTL